MSSPSPAVSVDVRAVAVQIAEKAERFLALLPLLAIAAIVVAIAWWIGGWLSRRAFLNRAGRNHPFLQDLMRTTVRWVVFAIGVVIALEILGATKLVGAVLGTAGVLGVALGFAFKDILENYLAGVLMSLRQPFAPRDHVVIDGNEGIVTALTSRATILMTLQGNHLRLPNALVFRSVILNYTRNPLRALEFDVGIGTGEDLLHTSRVAVDALGQVPGVLDDPPPRARVEALGDSTVQLRCLAWLDQSTHDFLMVRSEAIRVTKEALDAAGIEMPVPIYQVQGLPALREEEGGSPRQNEGAVQPVTPGEVAERATTGVDTRRTPDLLKQIDADREQTCAPDLLRRDAPRE